MRLSLYNLVFRVSFFTYSFLDFVLSLPSVTMSGLNLNCLETACKIVAHSYLGLLEPWWYFAPFTCGIVIFIGYLTIRPKVPQVGVTRAQLDTIYFDEASLLVLQVTITIKAENDNAKALARFYDTLYTLSFRSQKIAHLKADPFDVRPNQSQELNYVVQSKSIPLNREEAEEVGLSLEQKSIDLDLRGTSRTRWKVWLVGSVKYQLHLDCKLHLPVNRTTIYPARCSSSSK